VRAKALSIRPALGQPGAGPAVVGRNDPDKIRMVKGSHLVVDKLYDHDRCYIFQNADGRICFAIPYEQNFTLIGTTDRIIRVTRASPKIPEPRRTTCCGPSANISGCQSRASSALGLFRHRPLYDDGASKAQEATRDYVLKLDHPEGGAPLLSVFRRQDHHLPQAGGIGDGKDCAILPRHGQALDGQCLPARR
jgi:glycerol-3-phosphate dehydrogenase